MSSSTARWAASARPYAYTATGAAHTLGAEFAALGEDVAAVVAETRDISKTVGEMKTEARLRRSELSFRSTLLVAVIAAAASVASAWLAAHGVK